MIKKFKYFQDVSNLNSQVSWRERIHYLFCKSPYWKWNIFLFILICFLVSRMLMLAVQLFYQYDIGKAEPFLTSMQRWDANWYHDIAKYGYADPNISNSEGQVPWAFFPLFPMLIRAFYLLTDQDILIIGTIINSIAFISALYMAFRYIILTRENVYKAVLFVIFMTFGIYSFYFTALYTEAIFLFLLVSSLYHLKKRNYLITGVFGALLSATRNTGVLLIIAVIVQYISDYMKNSTEKSIKHFIKEVTSNEKFILCLAIIPLGIFCYMFYLWNLTGDPLAFMRVQIVWGRSLHNPFYILLRSLCSIHPYEHIMAFISWIGIYFLWFLLKRKRGIECVLGTFFLFIPLSTSIASMQRYLIGSFVFVLAFIDNLYELKGGKKKILILFVLCAYECILILRWFRNGHLY